MFFGISWFESGVVGMFLSLKLAVQFLTRIPIRIDQQIDERAMGRALIFYPLAGVLFSVILVSIAILLQSLVPGFVSITQGFVLSAIVLAVWVFLSGALHLDGLGDSADAWLGGNNAERTLAIMKDTHAGSAAVVAIVLVLLLKFSALQHLIVDQNYIPIFLAPLWARTSMLLLFATTDYVRPKGLGAAFMRYCSKAELLGLVLLLTVLLIFFGGKSVALLIAVSLLVFWMCRQLMLRRIGGTTGDTAGALLEVVEAVILVTAVFVPQNF